MRNILVVLFAILVLCGNANALDCRKLFSRASSSGSAPASLVPYWYDGLSVGNFDSSTNWQELSGIATANKAGNEPYLWIISDSPANMLGAINASNASNQGVWTLASPPTYSDWEDIESATVGGTPYLYVFDFGNNPNAADSRGAGVDMRIFRIVEPTVTGSNSSTSNYIAIDVAFPSAPTHRDCEAAIVDPDTRDIYIITKREGVPGVYYLPHAASYTGIQTLTDLGDMFDIPDVTTVALGATAVNVVDAAISPNGKEILVKNYNDIYYFARDKGTQTIYQALVAEPVLVEAYVGGGTRKSHPGAEPQGEGLCYSKDGSDLYTNSEYVSTEGSTATRYPLFQYKRSPKVPTIVSFQQGLNSYTGTSDTYIWGTNPAIDRSAETTIVLDITVGTPTDDRRALLKFDLSSIPTNATVVGANLQLYIAAEGQGWIWYKMLVPWDNTSTYNSLTGGVTNDGIEAAVAPSSINGINLDTLLNIFVRDNLLVSDVQSMVSNPATNYGWLGVNLDAATGDGVQFDSAEGAIQARRPMLTVRYIQ